MLGYRKLDLRVLPILFLLFMFKSIDKANIANAKLGGLEQDLGLTPIQYRWCLSIVYASMVLFELPSTIILRRWKANLWIGIMAIMWGGITMCMAATTNFAGLIVCRLLMGFFEAGKINLMLSTWYLRREYGRRISIFWASMPFSYAIGGLLAFGITEIPSEKMNTWQWLFIIEGIPSVLLGIIAIWCLPIRPADAEFLTDNERKLQMERFIQANSCPVDQGSTDFKKKYRWKDTKELLKDWKPYLYSYIIIIGTATGVGFNLTLPSIVHGMGDWSPAVSQALTVPPNICACILTVAAGYSSDYFLERSFHAAGFSLLSIAGLFMLMFLPEYQLGAPACKLYIMKMDSYLTCVLYSGTFTRRAVALAVSGAIGHMGGVIGPQFYFDGPRYLYGYTIAACLVISKIIAILLMRYLLGRENKKRRDMSPEEKQYIIEKYDLQETGDDRHPDFRFLL
ncbi:MFS general substrate transporter [Lichtheimia hyalospora FSU 10163]|nr:MFS general substrate transporter [Lichtheimia hyalospora FSU 10163]